MTKDINHLLKIAEKFDNSGLFSSSESIANIIKHISSKLTNDEYRKITKKIREASVKKSAGSKKGVIKQLLAIAAQFDAEGNFEEADKLTNTAKEMMGKGSDSISMETSSSDACSKCQEEIDVSSYSDLDKREFEVTGICKSCADSEGFPTDFEE